MNFARRVTFFTLIFVYAAVALAGCTVQGGAGSEAGNVPAASVIQSAEENYPVESVVESVEIKPHQGERSGSPQTLKQHTPQHQLGIPAAQAGTPPQVKKIAYLTFDDGPNSDYTEKILDILRRKKVKASFMVVGKNVELNPAVLQRTLADGHAVINHTYSHDYNTIYRSPEAFLADLDRSNKIIMQFTGRPVMFFRAPGGPDKLGPEFISKLRSRGYISVGWNISAVDSDPRGVSARQVYDNIVSGLERVERLKLSPIILMHDGTQLATTTAKPGSPLAAYIQNREATLEALPAIIDHFRSKGYTFAVVDEHTPPAW
ncbi:MAG: polysaccharide deacetylase [Peptococcaceae bacterium]|nr:polysaccharide deacetylase [Peptococcaceae bacterium]